MVKNNLKVPFERIFIFMFSVLMTQQILNLNNIFLLPSGDNKIILAAVMLLFTLWIAFETVLDFQVMPDEHKKVFVLRHLLRYILWFLQFIPLYYIFSVLKQEASVNISVVPSSATIADKCYAIANALGCINLLYLTGSIIRIKYPAGEQQDIEEVKNSIEFYSKALMLLLITGQVIQMMPEKIVAIFMSVVILTYLGLYIYYWKPYYEKYLFIVAPETK